MARVELSTVEADGVKVFYRSAGPPTAPVLLLLHGFPSSSFQFRDLIPLLASKFRVLAPDLPGFGFTEVLAERKYQYTFDNLSLTVEAFLGALKVDKFAVYIFDYGVRPSRFCSYAAVLTKTWRLTCSPPRRSASPCGTRSA
jgi:pimeloyl-ACP methyl ester carboxylesterase